VGYPVFFSYARANYSGPQGRLQRFLNELRALCAQRFAIAGTDVAFVDQDQKYGVEWAANITPALAQASTMVAIYSPDYFLSEFCGKEFQVLLDRRRKYIEDNPGTLPNNIIPVRWIAGGDSVPIPEFFVSLDTQSTYEQHGLDAVLDLVDADDKEAKLWYAKFKQRLVASIRDAIGRFALPPYPLPLKILDIKNAFLVERPRVVQHESEMDIGPNSATFVYVGAATDWEWDPASPCAPPPQDRAGQVSCVVASRNELNIQQLPFSRDTLTLLDRLQDLNGRVILMVNGQTLNQKPVREWLSDYETKKYKNCATLILGTFAPSAVFASPETRPPELFRDSIYDAPALVRALHSSLGALKPSIIKTSTNQRQGPAVPSGFQSLPAVGGPGGH
jgi:hypothetical protein